MEEHLQNWCARVDCTPERPRATINDHNTALYKDHHLDKLTMKHVEALVAIGNNAAHNKSDLATADVARLLRDVREFLVKHTTN